jgi:hypothetical protein
MKFLSKRMADLFFFIFSLFLSFRTFRFGFRIDEQSGVRRKTQRKDLGDPHTMLILKRVQENLYLQMRLSRGIETNEKRNSGNNWRDKQEDCSSQRLNQESIQQLLSKQFNRLSSN